MNIEKFKKLDIAKKLLERALKVYDDKDYFSALHLASAAEEILGQCLKFKNIENSLQSEKEAFKGLVALSVTEPDKSQSAEYEEVYLKWKNLLMTS